MQRAAVPETAVNEYRQASADKDDIGPARQLVVYPVPETERPEFFRITISGRVFFPRIRAMQRLRCLGVSTSAM